jgi:predicted ribosomally synthesized peptide with nif11-like leader
MSAEAVHEFIERMKSDGEFRARMLAAAGADERLALVKAEGYDVTAEEIASHARLEDDDLAHAVGGVVVALPPRAGCSGLEVGCS